MNNILKHADHSLHALFTVVYSAHWQDIYVHHIIQLPREIILKGNHPTSQLGSYKCI